MTAQIRAYDTTDEAAVVDLSIRAWTPVFASMAEALGDELFIRLHGADWREYQSASVVATLRDEDVHAWVAQEARRPVGFVAAFVRDTERGLGEIEMLAVDPQHQNRGVGTALTAHATEWLRGAGMRVAMIGTGGDRGHAPARSTYEKAHYTPMPIVRYFKAL